MKKNIFIVVALITSSFFVSKCSTDVDVAAPYKEIPVVFGMLCKDDSIQYIKINKAFLNKEGSAYVAGAVPDSNMFPYPLEVKLYAKNAAGISIDSVTLDTVRIQKNSGTFQANDIYYRTPPYKLKYLTASVNDTVWADYELVVRRASDRKLIVRATTSIVSNFRFNSAVTGSPPQELNLYNQQTKVYLDKRLSWGVPRNGRKYNAFLRFKFREVSEAEGVNRLDSLDMQIMRLGKVDPSGNILYTLSGVTFFTFIQNRLDPLPQTYRREYVGPVEIHFEFAGEELSNYMDITNGNVSLSDVSPQYTNVEGGLGIFSSRMRKKFNDVRQTNLSLSTIEGLKSGNITGRDAGAANDLGFR